MSGAKWEEMRAAAIDFIDRFGEDAVALGWTVTDLFGVHPTVGVIRVDYCGALMINARRVEAIGDTWIRYGNQTYRRDRPGRPVGVPVWEVGWSAPETKKPRAADAGGAEDDR